MFARLKAAGLLIPTVMTVLMLPVLLALGAWQLERKHWKEDLIARLAIGRSAEPVPLTAVRDTSKAGGTIEYTRLRATGAFDHAAERFVYAPRPEAQGWDVYTPLNTDAGRVYVYRGWVPDKLKDPALRAQGQIAGEVTLTGLARMPETRGLFTLADDPKANRWYVRDPAAFDQGGAGGAGTALPFSIDAEAEPANPGGWPKPTPTEIRLSNRHLEYVVTWWGLAVTLLVVYGLFARQRLRKLQAGAPTT